jgi:hypothetical protein
MDGVTTRRMRRDEAPITGKKQQDRPVDYIEFGCGSKKPLHFAASMMPGYGYGIDNEESVVNACRAQGVEVHLGNLLDYNERNAAAMTLAINLMPDLGGRSAFEKGFGNLVRAARNFSIVQHAFFDNDSLLATKGWQIADNFGKKIEYKPTAADYIHLVKRLSGSLQICGIGIFGLGQPELLPLRIEDTGEPSTIQNDVQSYRTLRVVIGRKDNARFRAGMQKAGSGQALYVWERN